MFFLKMHMGFEIGFQGGVRSQITFLGPLNDYLGHNKGYWGLNSP